jgi:ABC-type polysaccharide/polyol phosphate export permease
MSPFVLVCLLLLSIAVVLIVAVIGLFFENSIDSGDNM